MREELKPCKLKDCPPGPFMFGGHLGFKTEYGAMIGKDIGKGQVEWIMVGGPDPYVMASGEVFWGGVSDHAARAELIVTPIDPDELLAAWNTRSNPPQEERSDPLDLAAGDDNRKLVETYDAGLLNDFGGGNVEWWQDYIRAELGRAHDHYTAQMAADDNHKALVEAVKAVVEHTQIQWAIDRANMKPGSPLCHAVPVFKLDALKAAFQSRQEEK